MTAPRGSTVIPATAHFIWYGRQLPWVHALAPITAARNGGFDRVYLHHADEPNEGEGWAAARAEPRVTLRALQPRARLAEITEHGPALVQLYDRLQTFPSRANMQRAAILYAEGGVYLDTDTLTIASLTPLRTAHVFAGLEYIALPDSVRRSFNPMRWARAGGLLVLRDLLRRAPTGHRLFQHAAPLFARAANNAVLGASADHPFVAALLAGMVSTPRARQTRRFSLGTGVLQAQLEQWQGRDADVILHPPPVFYPLGPEISEHWFATRQNPDLDAVLSESTRVIHWYASVRTQRVVPHINAAYLDANAQTQLFSAAARSALRGRPG